MDKGTKKVVDDAGNEMFVSVAQGLPAMDIMRAASLLLKEIR